MLHGISSLDNWRQYFGISKLIRALTTTFIAKTLSWNFRSRHWLSWISSYFSL